MDEWVGGWVDGWKEGGSKSHIKDCLQQTKNKDKQFKLLQTKLRVSLNSIFV